MLPNIVVDIPVINLPTNSSHSYPDTHKIAPKNIKYAERRIFLFRPFDNRYGVKANTKTPVIGMKIFIVEILFVYSSSDQPKYYLRCS